MDNSTDQSLECITCREKVHKGAIKCTHCGSFQNWRRHLGLSSSFLSLVLAIISVLTVFITVVSDSTTKKDSDIDASIINWQRTYFSDSSRLSQVLIVETFVTNSGKKPAAIKAFSIKGAGEEQFHYLTSGPLEQTDRYSHKETKAQIVEPGKTLLLKNHLKTLLDVQAFEERYSNSVLQLEVVHFSGRKQDLVLEVKNLPPVFFK